MTCCYLLLPALSCCHLPLLLQAAFFLFRAAAAFLLV
jgi:hypothetical protein